jgi:hypothetical protein
VQTLAPRPSETENRPSSAVAVATLNVSGRDFAAIVNRDDPGQAVRDFREEVVIVRAFKGCPGSP